MKVKEESEKVGLKLNKLSAHHQMTGLKCFLCEYIHAHAQWNITQQWKKIVFCSNMDLEIIILSEVTVGKNPLEEME